MAKRRIARCLRCQGSGYQAFQPHWGKKGKPANRCRECKGSGRFVIDENGQVTPEPAVRLRPSPLRASIAAEAHIWAPEK